MEKDRTYPSTLKLVRTSHKVPRIRNPDAEREGFVLVGPKVGEPLWFSYGDARLIHTSEVVSIDWKSDGFQIETRNSVYAVYHMEPEDVASLRLAVEPTSGLAS